MIPLSKPYFDGEEIEEVRKVMESGWVIQGPKVKELEKGIADYLGIKHAICVINCTSALHLSLLSLGIKEGDEVIVSDYTFPATGHAVLYCNAKPVFCDVDIKTYNIDPGSIEQKITDKTKAIIPVHTFGQPAQMDKIMQIADKFNLKVIEDAACALGAKYKNRFAGTLGDIGCFSFHGRKGITTGEGGIVVTDDDKIAETIRTLSVYGMTRCSCQDKKKDTVTSPEFRMRGYNYKMSDIVAAIGVAQLRKLDKIIERKRILAEYWDKELETINFINTPFVNKNATHIYQSYVTLLDKGIDRNDIIKKLMDRGVQTQIGTYSSHIQPVYNSKDVCPNSLDIFKRSLALPIYYNLKKEDIDKGAEAIKETLEVYRGVKK